MLFPFRMKATSRRKCRRCRKTSNSFNLLGALILSMSVFLSFPPQTWAQNPSDTGTIDNENTLKISRRRLLHYWSVQDHYRRMQNDTNTNVELRPVLEMVLHQSYAHSHNVSQPHSPPHSPNAILENLMDTFQQTTFPPMPPSKQSSNRQLVKDMFQHAYDSYMYYGYPSPEVKPKSCQPGQFHLAKIPAITLIDSLDMLLIMGNYSEFARSVERLRILDEDMRLGEEGPSPSSTKRQRWTRGIFQSRKSKVGSSVDRKQDVLHPLERKKKYMEDHDTTSHSSSTNSGGIFAINESVSVFETNIRVVGGLLSAHLMAQALFTNTSDLDSNVVTLGDVWDYQKGNVRFGPTQDSNSWQAEEYNTLCSSSCITNTSSTIPPLDDGRVDDMDRLVHGLNMRFNVCLSQSSLPIEILFYNPHYALSNVTPSSHKPTDETCDCDLSSFEFLNANTNLLWKYDGLLLKLAQDMGKRLLPAFDTPTGIPYGTVNLIHGVPKGETTIASLAGAGTLTLELETLSRLTGDESFGKAAKRAIIELWNRRSETNLVGKHIDVTTGQWTEMLSGIGSNSDSFYEYILKHYLLFPEDEEFWTMFQAVYSGIYYHNKMGDWYSDVDIGHGAASTKFFSKLESLMAFYPGLQVLLGELQPSARTTNSIFLVREFLGFLPERFSFQQWAVESNNNGNIHPLRPELIESCYFLHLATKGVGEYSSNNTSKTSGWLWAADFALHTLERLTRAQCGYCTVNNVSPERTGIIGPQLFGDAENTAPLDNLDDEMPSFFLSETLKYFYLMFDETNFLHTDMEKAWVFTTEAHPLHWVEFKDPVRGQSSEEEEFRSIKDELMRSLNKSLAPETESELDSYDSKALASEISTKENIAENDGSIVQVHGRVLSDKRHGSDDLGLFYEDALEMNAGLAVQSSNGRGDGFSLKRSCSNFGHSNALWFQALSGDSMDYNSFFSTSFVNKDSVLDYYDDFRLVSPLSIAAFYGNKIFSGDVSGCKILTQVKSDSAHQEQQGYQYTHTQKLVLDGNLGEFHVNTHVDNPGFSVLQISTGEEVRVTFFTESSIIANPTLIIVDYQPNLTTNSADSDFLSQNTLRRISLDDDALEYVPLNLNFKRKALVADVTDHVYNCEIVLSDETGNLLKVLPCSPATFGPTDIKNLIGRDDGIEVEAILKPPDNSDPYGCNTTANLEYSTTDDYYNIQLVHRGECTFEQKSTIDRPNSLAVIVINNQADRLFLMAGSQTARAKERRNGSVSVLITETDGDDLIRLLQMSQISALIRISAYNAGSSKEWPIVESREDKIQVLAPGGWGVVAARNNNNNMLPFVNRPNDDKGTWQIFVFPHNNLP